MKDILENVNSVLVLAPHTDDGEFGCGGTISKLVSSGARVVYVAFSAAEQSVLPHLPSDILRTEVKCATSLLGVAEQDLRVLDFNVRTFPENRQAILDAMIKLREEIQPDIVFLPSPNDTHQDHNTIAHEGFRAFKNTTMLGYEVPWNNLEFRTSGFSILEEKHVIKKVEALNCYKSQEHRAYASERFIRSLMITRGTQIGVEYAESFEVIRWVFR